jgi:hypothetical protein
MNEYMPTDKQFEAQLIDEYSRLKRIRDAAAKEGAVETVKTIDLEISYIKLKLHPLVLPEEDGK